MYKILSFLTLVVLPDLQTGHVINLVINCINNELTLPGLKNLCIFKTPLPVNVTSAPDSL